MFKEMDKKLDFMTRMNAIEKIVYIGGALPRKVLRHTGLSQPVNGST